MVLAVAFALLSFSAAPAAAANPAARAAPAPASNQLLEDALALGDPQQAPAAEKRLSAAGVEGLAALLRIAEAAGPAKLQERVASKLRCPRPMTGSFRQLEESFEGSAVARSIDLAMAMVEKDPALFPRLARSDKPGLRALAGLTWSVASPQGKDAVAAAVETESDLRVLQAVEQGIGCSGVSRSPTRADTAGIREALRARQRALGVLNECSGPSEAAGLIEEAVAGTLKSTGWSSSGRNLELRWSASKGPVEVAPACAVAVYRGAAEKGVRRPGLVLPVLTEQPEQAKALGLVETLRADLEALAPDEQQAANVALINAGVSTGLPVALDSRADFQHENTLAAAERSGNRAASDAIRAKLFCPFSVQRNTVAMLVAWKDPKAGAELLKLGQLCPRSRDGLAAALLRRGDAGWAKLLPLLEKEEHPMSFELERALGDKAVVTPAVLKQTAALAAKSALGARLNDLAEKTRRAP